MTSSPDTRFDAMTAELIAGRYRIIRRIARGSMGVVLEAEQVPLGRTVALKVLDPRSDLIRAEEASMVTGSVGPTDRFLREATSAGRLTHPNIAVVYDYGEFAYPGFDEPLRYIAMEYIPGKPLSDFTSGGVPMPVPQAIAIVRQILDALEVAHDAGIVHRDLKPSNVILTEDGRAKVVDFGLAKRLDDTEELETHAGLILGTPAYMSPEQLLGGEPSPQTDLYSTACVLARLVTGRPVYKGATSVETMSMHITEACPAFAELPEDLRRILHRGLAKKPEERFCSAKAFKEALDAVRLEDEGTLVVSATRWNASPVVWLVSGSAVVLLLLGGLAALTLARPTPAPVAVEEPPEAPEDVRPAVQEPPAPPPRVALASTPTGAEVFDGEEQVCTTPCDLEFAEERELVFRAQGFADAHYTVTSEGSHAVALQPVVEETRPRARPRSRPRPEPKPVVDPPRAADSEPADARPAVGTAEETVAPSEVPAPAPPATTAEEKASPDSFQVDELIDPFGEP